MPTSSKRNEKTTAASSRMASKLSWAYLRNNVALVSFISAYLMVNFGLFTHRAIQYADHSAVYILARAAGWSFFVPFVQ